MDTLAINDSISPEQITRGSVELKEILRAFRKQNTENPSKNRARETKGTTEFPKFHTLYARVNNPLK